MAKKRERKEAANAPQSTSAAISSPLLAGSSDYLLHARILTLLFFVFFWGYSQYSDGFYQQDEVGHYLQIIDFWSNPLMYLLDMWSRGGYKLIYALPGLLGKQGVIFTNIFFSASSCYLAFLIARHYRLKYPLLAIVFTGMQPFVLNLSFRSYSEIPSMFFMTLLVYVFLKDKYKTAALLSSFLFTIRQELAVFALILGVFFLIKRQWLPFILLSVAPLVLNLLGWIKYNDAVYVWSMMTKGGLQDSYARNGFFYLWLMLPEIMGIIIFYFMMLPFIGFLFKSGKWKTLKKYAVLLLAFGVYFLMHCAFTSKSFGFGRSGGLGRFLMVVLPLGAVIALGGVHYLISEAKRSHKLISVVISLIIIAIFFSYQEEILPAVFYGYVSIADVSRNLNALVLAVLCCFILVFFQRSGLYISLAITGILMIYGFSVIKPIELNAEDTLMNDASGWVLSNASDVQKIYSDHIMFDYFYRDGGGSKTALAGYDSTTLLTAKPGELFVFENHYAIKKVNPDRFNNGQFQILKEFSDNSSNVKSFIIRKMVK